MPSLSADRIAKLASAKNVRSIAVHNFLGSLYDSSERDAQGNLNMDARLYKWNAPTVNAIRKGIQEHFRK